MTLTADEIQQMDSIFDDTISKLPQKQPLLDNHSLINADSVTSDLGVPSDVILDEHDISEMDKIANVVFSTEKDSVFDGLSDEDKNLYLLDSDVNFKALNSMPEIPDEVLGLYGLNENTDYISKYFDADQWSEWEEKGKVGIAEAWNKKKKYEMLPWVGTSAETAKTVNIALTANRLKNGLYVREEDEEAFRQYVLHTAEMEARGGYTFGGGVVDIVTGSVPYLVEFGAGLATAPEGGVGLALIATTLAKKGTKEGAKKTLKTAIKKGIAKEALKQLPRAVGSSIKFGVTKMPQHFVGSIADRQLTSGIAITPNGDMIFSDSENLATSIFKALGETTFEVMSETSGGLFAPITKYFAKPVRNVLPQSFYKNFDKLVSTKFGMSTSEVLKKYGYHGVIEEMGEEALNRLLCQTFGLNGLESYNLDGFLNNVLYADDPSKWGQEATAFALTSGVGHIGAKTASILTTNEAIKRKYKADNLYLDQGLVRVKGSKSLAQQELEKVLKQNNVSDETISSYFATHSENDFQQALYEFKSNEINKEQLEASQKLETQANEVKDKVFTMLTEKGMDAEQADALSKLFKARAKVASKWASSPMEWFNNLGLQFNNATQQENKTVLNGGVTYEQGAYHGGAKNFDRFDLSFALSGEGAMAHGHGVYTAKNKNVSEKYRKKLVDLSSDIGTEISSGNKKYRKSAFNTYSEIDSNNNELSIENEYLRGALNYIDKTNNDKEKALKDVQEDIDGNLAEGRVSEARYFLEIKEILQNNDFEIISRPETFGQLYEVEIPDDDVLLDEDKLLDEQPEKVQEALKKLFKEHPWLEEFLDNMIDNPTGKTLYRALTYDEYTPQEASELLNSYGIKGITYDGKQDGRCYVIFDDKAVEIVQKFYQGGKHLKQLKRSDGELVNVEYYDNSDIQEVKALNIRTLKFSNISNAKDIKKKDIANEVFEDKEKIYIKNSKSKINASLSLNSLKKIISTIYRPEKENSYTRLEKEIIANIETIFENAIPVLKHSELKRKSLFDVQIVHRFALPIKIGNANFLTMITVKERKDFKELKLDEFTIYDLKSEIKNKKTLDRYSMSEDSKESGQSRSQVLNYSMNDIIDFVNSNLDKYKVTLNQGGKKDENDIDYTEYFFGQKKVNLENKEQFDKFVDEFSSEETRASITFENKALNEPKAIIELFENADKSSFLHEMAHLFLQDIIYASRTNDEAKKELDRINEYLGHISGEYTRQEHEKWAKGFEVYLINGKAPNAGLKTAYDTFKTWLREIYNFVLASNGTLSRDVFSVYDSLFKDYNPDEMEVVRSIVSNAIRTANNASDGLRSLNDEQKRFKETAYHILSVALNKKIPYLKTVLESSAKSKKQIKVREKLEEQLANVGDEISSKDGMLPEWKEFFPDYGNDVDSDYNLAYQAYRVIVEKSYLDYDSNIGSDLIDSALFAKLEKAYQYIMNVYKNGDSKQKDYAVASMFEWLENNLPNEMYQEIFSEMFTHDFRELERLENLDKFERAKENISSSARMINEQNSQKEFNQLVTSVLNGLSFLTSNDKSKIFNNLMQYKNSEELRNDLDNIMDIAKILDTENYFKSVEAKIQKALAGTKNIKQANKSVGKYTFDINQVFSDLRRYNNMTREKAQNELEMVIDFEGEEDASMSFEDKLRHKFLYYKATPSMYISSDFISDLYKDIITLKNWGYLAKEREKLLKKVDVEIKKENLLRVLDGKKKSNKFISGYVQGFGNWESALNAIFNSKVKEQYSLLDREANVQNWQHKQKEEFLFEATNIFGVNRYKFDNLMIDKISEKYKFIERGAKRNHEIELNKLNIIQAYIWAKNTVLKERLIRQFGEAGLKQMFAKLDNEEIEFANLMQRTASKFYNEANRVYIRKYGVELPKVENYFPSQTERVSIVDLLADFSFQSATSPSFIKNRVNSRMPMMRFSNPLMTLFGHIDKMGVFIHMTDTIDMYNKIFTDSDIKKRIISLYGESTYEAFGTILANSSYQKQGAKIDKINGIFNKLVSNFVTANIILKPSIAFKQLLSTVNYAENMPVGTWAIGYLKALVNPKETIKFMMSDEYLKTRFSTGGQNEYLKQSIEHSRFAKTRKFIDYLSLNVKLGDMGAIVFGGKPYIDYLMSVKGMTKENAFKEFRLSTMRSQQASMPSSLSNFQNNFTNPWVRGLFAFRNTPNQYFRKVADAIISYSNGDISIQQCGKTIFIYTFLNAFMYNIATSLSILAIATGGDDGEDLGKDIVKSLFDFNSQAVPVIGDLYVYVIDRLMGMKRKGNVSIPAITDLFDIVEQLTADDVTLEDWLECLASFGDVSTGLPVQSAVNMTGGAVDVVTGKLASGALRMVGYTKRRAEKVTGESKE